ncbi:MAG: hypothetical protein LKF54_02710 [Bacilli bacterium]|jgi:hypothetical protein|nr:hypothetical protein [Bacilli bacterium]
MKRTRLVGIIFIVTSICLGVLSLLFLIDVIDIKSSDNIGTNGIVGLLILLPLIPFNMIVGTAYCRNRKYRINTWGIIGLCVCVLQFIGFSFGILSLGTDLFTISTSFLPGIMAGIVIFGNIYGLIFAILLVAKPTVRIEPIKTSNQSQD